MANKKPAPKGGKKIAAPKKAAKAAPKKGRASNDPTPIEETNPPMPPLADPQQGRAWADLTERQADQLIADKMRADAFASTQSARQTVEEQWAEARERYFNTLSDAASRALHAAEQARAPAKKSLWSRFRSAVTGLFVSKQYAEANPDTTVRERAD